MDGGQTIARCLGFETTLDLGPTLALGPQHGRTGQMARITLRQLLDHAAEHDYGVPAFNINNMEQALAIMTAASSVDAPVIIQASRGARSYANDIMLRHMMDAVTEIYPQIPVSVHLHHGNPPPPSMTPIHPGFPSSLLS